MHSCDGAVILGAPANGSSSTGTCRPLAGHAEPGAENVDVGRAEEHGAEFFVDGGEQHEQRGEPGVDVPVRELLAVLAPRGPGPAVRAVSAPR
jgi:hypothetical protein